MDEPVYIDLDDDNESSRILQEQEDTAYLKDLGYITDEYLE